MNVAGGPTVCLLFSSVKVELSHFAPNYFAVNLPDGSCPAVLIQHLTLSLFIDTSNSEVRPARLTTSQLGHLYDVTEAPCHVPMRAICPPATAATQSPATKLPFFFDLSGDRWQSIKYIISSVSFYLAAVSLRERCFVQQKILQPSFPLGETYNCFFAGVMDDGNKCFLSHLGDAPWPYSEGTYLVSDTEQNTRSRGAEVTAKCQKRNQVSKDRAQHSLPVSSVDFCHLLICPCLR